MKMRMSTLTCYGSMTTAVIKTVCWILLFIFTSADLQTGMHKKYPTDLMCYQNYTSTENFCYCSWRAGEDSVNAIYTLYYFNQEQLKWDGYDAGNRTYHIFKSYEVHMKKNISVSVAAKEEGKEYWSANFTVLLDKAVKLDPPDQKNFTIKKKDGYVSIHWTRIDRFSDSMKTIKEVQCKINEHSFRMDRCLLYKTSNPPNCILEAEIELPICQESCTLVLDGHKGHHIQIRQKYEEGVWSEWSDSVFVPADIGYTLEPSYVHGKLDNTGMRNIKLKWKPSTEEQGDMKYDISFTLLPCPYATVRHQTKVNWFNSSISGASYNVTVTSSNQAEEAPTWSSLIKEDWKGIPFKSVNLSGKNLTMKWKWKTSEKASLCIEWRSVTGKEHIFSNLAGIYESNQATIPTALLSIGPGNLTVMNVTAQSVLLKWDAFDLRECLGLLKNWVINLTDLNTNISTGEISENASVTQYLVQDLPLGFSYTFEVNGVTIYGEHTGSSFKSVSSPVTAENDDSKGLPGRIALILLVVLAVVIIICFVIKRLIIYPDLPDPSNSNAATFVFSDNKYIVSPKYLMDTSCEDKHVDPLMIEPIGETEAIKVTVRETEVTDLVITKHLSDNDLVVMTEAEAEAETDSQVEYRKQVVPMTPGSERESVIHFFGKLKDDLAHQAELSKETDVLLILNVDTKSVLET
ncbi:interleukin-12 receptor subunit beta-1 isoform X2 [Mixophyes fleayi]|uniref:interleukin-12 receptor subunit beta-1 isoform X2 n=1 Tax=Mixophyes fleayi TaxID=3061075 RepID=UPI003F4D7E88